MSDDRFVREEAARINLEIIELRQKWQDLRTSGAPMADQMKVADEIAKATTKLENLKR